MSNQQYNVKLKNYSGSFASERSDWFQEARFGMFVHWGLYSILGGRYKTRIMPDKELPNGNSWYSEWIQMRLEVPKAEYSALTASFNPHRKNIENWVLEAKLAGMKYLVLTTKHHDGFALWYSDVSDFDLSITPCEFDILEELSKACKKYNIRLGFYYSHWQDWEYPGGALPPWPDKTQPNDNAFEQYWQQKCLPQVKELLGRYSPDMLWFDSWGDKAEKQITPKRRDEMIDLIRSVKEECLINGRLCAHDPGDRVDYISAGDNQYPEKNLGRPWQTPATMSHSWAWHSGDFNWKSSRKMIELLAVNASLGGNYLLNIGPYADGSIPAPALRRLREIGGWLAVNGESIYCTQTLDDIPVPSWGRLTKTGKQQQGQSCIYAHVINWENNILKIPEELGRIAGASVLETGEPVKILEDGRAFQKPEDIDQTVNVIRLRLK